jgi:hypothetical protein
MAEKESEGWDIKFQNYWGYIVAAGDNEDQCKSMCQKLFNHVGQFREFVEQYVQKVVDKLHEPSRNENSDC